jgi:hypothetical protein
MHPSWDVTFQTACQKADLRPFLSIFGLSELARGLLYLIRLRNVLLPPRETFCWTERVQERKGLHAFFFVNGVRPHLLAKKGQSQAGVGANPFRS